MPQTTPANNAIDLFYLAWGKAPEPLTHFKRFFDSYRVFSAGIEHNLFILYKGFENAALLAEAHALFSPLMHKSIYVDEHNMDIGAYFVGASQTNSEYACFLNTYSEILGSDWLIKIWTHVQRPEVGLVSCSSSYEAPQHSGIFNNPRFPNPHLRSNAFMLRRKMFLSMRPDKSLASKLSTHLFEHGADSMTQNVTRRRLAALVVGRDGRAFTANEWPVSRTFRQGEQPNLLIGDNRTRDYDQAPLSEKRELYRMAWKDRSCGNVSLVPSEQVSTEAAFVESVYQGILGRHPQLPEIKGWVNFLNTGRSRAELIEKIRRSPEGRLGRGNPLLLHFLPRLQQETPDQLFIMNLYNEILGREAQPTETEGWLDYLRKGHSRDALVAEIRQSEEARSRRKLLRFHSA